MRPLTISSHSTDTHTDNGPPFNGKDSHALQQYFRWAGIKHDPTISSDDPEANGLAESVMKHCKKIWHTAIVERKNPRAEINKHLMKMRTTPHPATKKSPAELLFNRRIRTRLPQTTPLIGERPDIIEAINEDQKAKKKQKEYKDKKAYVKPHQIEVGDSVLLKQKTTKSTPPYDPLSYTVTEVRGHQITAERDQQKRTRDAQKWKKVEIRQPTNYQRIRQERARTVLHQYDDPLDIGTPHIEMPPPPPRLAVRQEPPVAVLSPPRSPHAEEPLPRPRLPPPRRSIRVRRQPRCLADYVR